MPPEIVHGVTTAGVPVRVHVLVPILLKVVKPVYCVPMLLALNVSLPVPPSWKVSLPNPCTLPLMTLPGPRVSVLPPKNANTIAGPLAAEIVPALNTVVWPSVAMALNSPMIKPPALLVTLPLAISIAGPPLPAATDMVPEFVTLTTSPEMAPDAALMPPEIVPKFVTVRVGVCDPEIALPSPVMTPEA